MIGDLHQRLASLSPEKRMLVEMMRKTKRAGLGQKRTEDADAQNSALQKLPFALISDQDKAKLPQALDVEDCYPMTMLQRGMLYQMELTADRSTPHYHNVNSFHLRVAYDGQAFARAVEYVVARHATLRTSFDLTTFSEPMQLVHRKAVLPVKIEDLRHLSYDEQQEELERFWDLERTDLFDTCRPSLMRFHLHRRTEDTLQLTLTEQHAISDGWSTTSTLAEIFKNYLALLKNRAMPNEPPLAASYRDFVVLEQRTLDSEECQQYWARKLSDCSVIRLPRFPSRFRYEEEQRPRKRLILFSSEVAEGLNRLARLASAPLKSVLLAAHMKVMSILSGQSDILTGLLCNGRPEEIDGEQIRGLFLNTVPFRLKLPAGSWVDLVRQTFDAEVELLPYRRYPLAALQQKWGTEPLFEAAFTFLHFHSVDELLNSDDFEYLTYGDRDLSLTNFALSVVFQVKPGPSPRLTLVLDHDANVLNEGQFDAIEQYFERVLEAMATDALAKHHTQCFLSEEEQRQVLVDWNDTFGEYAQDATIAQLFEAQVESTPEAIAVVFGAERLTYEELNWRANRLAHYLQRFGAGPEVLLGICMERSTEFIVAILATLKIGSAYLPLDPTYPPERLALILRNSKVHLLLKDSALSASLPVSLSGLVCVDREAALIAQESRENPLSRSNAAGLAYVIYTSGSTGTPKGVMVCHQGFCNLMQAQIRTFDVRPDSRVLQFASFTFDASLSEIFMTLLSGATLVLESRASLLPGQSLIELLRDRAITTVTLPPSTLSSLPRTVLTGLRTIVVAGETCPDETVSYWGKDRRFINAYGPTEATVCATTAEYHGETERLTIGRPIQNTKVYLLDQWLQPVPVGVRGEMYLAGVGLARGYWQSPALTAECFICNPFSNEGGSLLYKTGDLARYLPDGNLEYLGRRDRQVKVRGFRIEPGEIETILREHPVVKEAVVAVYADTAVERRLVAYLVANPESSITQNELRGFLRQRLPEHMIPSTFIMLPGLTLTINGKIDRRALPRPERVNPEVESAYVPPGTPIEEVLVEIWSSVLGLERVGVDDNFLEIGGHSLLATSVMSRVRETFQLEISLRALFDAPTVRGLAQYVESSIRAKQSLQLPPLERISNRHDLPLSFAQQRVWFFDQLEPGNPAYNIPFAVRLRGVLDVAALKRALSELVRRHESLRTTFPTVDNMPVQHIAQPRPLGLPLVDLTELASRERQLEVEELATAEARRRFDLASGPLLRAMLLRIAEDEHVALLTMHHIVSDGWSIGILIRELAALYGAYSQGKETPLAELTVQYGDYAAWQRKWLQGEILERELSYWREQLAGAPAALALPTDYAQPTMQMFRGAQQSVVLSPELSAELKQLSRREGATLFMTLLAAFNVLLLRYTGRKDIVIGSPVAGRSKSVTEGLIGFFVNVLALRIKLDDNPTFYELLKQVRAVTLDAYTHQDLPFEKLIEELHPDRNQNYAPLYNVMFVFQNAPMSTLELPGLALSLIDVEKGTAKLDLSVYAGETSRGIALAMTYNTDLFNRQTIIQMLSRFQTLLENIVLAPAKKISTFSFVSTKENEQITNAFNEPLEVF